MKYCLWSIGFWFGFPLWIWAQSDSTAYDSISSYHLGINELYSKLQNSESNYFEFLEVTSASKIKQNQADAPNIINAYPRNHFINYAFISPNELLYSQAGFFPTQDFDRRTVGFRGMFESWNNNTILMLVDGIPFNGSIYGSAFSSEITPLFYAKSVELIRGAGGALYGSNALNGVLSMNTPKVSDLEEGTGEVRMRYGSKNTQIFECLLGTENEYIGMIGAFNFFATDGNDYRSFDDSERTDNQGVPMKFRIQDARQNFGFFNKIYGKRKLTGLSLQFHAQEWDFGTGHGWLFQVPDEPENMQQSRQSLAIRYAPPRPHKALIYEISFRYQRQGINWDMRYYPNGAFDNFYPNGVTEYLRTKTQDIFLRIQGNYQTSKGTFLMGFEGNRFLYAGDEAHVSNIDLEHTFEPFPNHEFRPMGAWLEYIENRPVRNLSAFVQYVSPKFWDKIQLTASGRYDYKYVDYQDITLPNFPESVRIFRLFTPRLALVFQPANQWTFKAIAGRAFRTPAPSEMFGSNTFSLASNIKELQPELVTNYDLSTEYRWSKNMTLRTNIYWVNFENKIGYSIANANLSTNIYTLQTAGFESEINWAYKNWEGFANYTFAQRLGEQITDTTISENKNEVTFAPAHFWNVGSRWNYKQFFVVGLVHFHGKQKRKATDFYEQSETFRPDEIPAWVNAELQLGGKINRWLEMRILCRNILNTKQLLLKTGAYRFDYQRENRQIQSELRLRF